MPQLAGAEEQQADLDFDAGFNLGTPSTEKPIVTADPEAKIEATPKPEADPKAAPQDAPKVTTEPKPPEYVQITKEQYESLDAAAKKTVDFEKKLDTLFGTTGQMKQLITTLQSATPAGADIELPDDVVSEMEQDFPELAGHFRKALQKALKGKRGTADAATGAPDPETLRKLVHSETVKLQTEALEEDHPTWRAIVGTVDSAGTHDPNNEFRKWLATQDVAYQTKVNATNSAGVISKAIDKFNASKAAPAKPAQPAPKIVARNDRIRDAIQPKGDGGQPGPSKTADDDFNEGFRTG